MDNKHCSMEGRMDGHGNIGFYLYSATESKLTVDTSRGEKLHINPIVDAFSPKIIIFSNTYTLDFTNMKHCAKVAYHYSRIPYLKLTARWLGCVSTRIVAGVRGILTGVGCGPSQPPPSIASSPASPRWPSLLIQGSRRLFSPTGGDDGCCSPTNGRCCSRLETRCKEKLLINLYPRKPDCAA